MPTSCSSKPNQEPKRTWVRPRFNSYLEYRAELRTRLRLGMMFFSTSFFWLVSSPIQGALIGINGSYWPVAVFGGSTTILGVGFMLMSRYLVRRETSTWRV